MKTVNTKTLEIYNYRDEWIFVTFYHKQFKLLNKVFNLFRKKSSKGERYLDDPRIKKSFKEFKKQSLKDNA